jgi:ankyrin repeat protein
MEELEVGSHKSIVKMLLQHPDIKIDERDKFGRTPLSQAVAGGQMAIVELLFGKGNVDINSKDDFVRQNTIIDRSGQETICNGEVSSCNRQGQHQLESIPAANKRGCVG